MLFYANFLGLDLCPWKLFLNYKSVALRPVKSLPQVSPRFWRWFIR